MGGKHKMANRTKNNARPSSSGRSAELLSNSISHFAGTSSIKEGLLLPGFSLEEIESTIDTKFQLVLKKITKKDSTTKIKGLQEFAELIKNSESETVKAVLPLWPRLYNSLATDTDNRVREAAHVVQQQIVLKVKRNIAPYLKQLMAPWFISQYDNYAPAASVATQAFKDAFPPNKFTEAIVFCQVEILAYINDNLLVQTAQTLTSAKTISADDAEAKYERILISCLQGYALYLEKVPIEQIESVSMLNNDIISNSKFWKLGKHPSPPVRLAFYKVLTALFQRASFLLDDKEKQIINAVFNNLDESQMELVITLPTNYPLGGPDVQCNRQIGGITHKQWLMQLKKCVLHQNGRIWDGLSLWNNNLDKKFDGVEECYICFAVLHPTYQLPKLSCHTCKKKFHSACLYKWFSTSNKSSCPICRNLF